MADWVTEHALPCFRPHVRRDDAGNVLYEITPDDLPEIAANSGTVTVELHGNKPPITEGHRDFDGKARECDQPLVLGYLENFRVGSLPDGTPAVVCDRKVMTRHAETYRRHPFPSVDYLPNRKAIVGLAKLTRPPALNTGAVYYPGTTEPVYVYSAAVPDPATDPNAPGGPSQDPEPVAPVTDPALPAQPPVLTPEEQAGMAKIEAYLFAAHPWMAAAAADYAAKAANPNPDPDPEPEPAKPADPDEKVEQMAADAALVQKYDATQAQLKKVQADLKAERDKRVAAEVDGLLDQLEKVEQYQFDRPAERAEMLGMTEAARAARAERIRKFHPQVGGDRIEVYRGTVGGPKPAATQAQATRAREYANKNKVEYAEALDLVLSGKA